MTAPAELRTERLLLRSFEEFDIPDIVRLAGAREVAATTLLIPHPYTEADARDFLQHSSLSLERREGVVFAITRAETGELCGATGLHLLPAYSRAEIGYWIGVPYWRRGYASEAAMRVLEYGFGELQLNRIYAQCFSENAASRRVLEKLGMHAEGRLRQHVEKWGQIIDLDVYRILRHEFEAAQ